MSNSLPESLSAIVIVMAVASMCFTSCYVYKSSHAMNWMVLILLMLIISAVVRVIERFNLTGSLISTEHDSYGYLIGVEISITWGCLLLSEWLIAMKYFEVSS